MASNGDSGSRDFFVKDPFRNTYLTVSGTTGTVILSPQGSTNVTSTLGKFVFNQGWRRHITSVASLVSLGSTYNVLFSDDYIAITT